jgi:hypothetical protein
MEKITVTCEQIEGTDFRLVADKDADFVILGAFLQPVAK